MSRSTFSAVATCLVIVGLLGCSEGATPVVEPRTPPPPGPPPPPPPPLERPVYQVSPPEGKLPWPHHDPAWDRARYDAMLDSVWVITNFGAYTGTADRSVLYLHDAFDLVLPNGTPIYSVAAGTVRWVLRGDEFYSSVFVEDEDDPGYGWGYTHVYHFRVAEGDRVHQGTQLGVVNFRGTEHIHLTRVRFAPDYRSYTALQPDRHFVFRDTEAPEFVGSFRYVRNMTDSTFVAPAPEEPVTVSGDVDIIVPLREPGEWTRSKAPFAGFPAFGDAHAVSRIEYEIVGPTGVAHRVVSFDLSKLELPRAQNEERAEQLLTLYQHWESASPQLPRERFGNRLHYYYVITNSSGWDGSGVRSLDPMDRTRSWRTAELDATGVPRFPNGEYTVTVRAFDSVGNAAERTERVRVRN